MVALPVAATAGLDATSASSLVTLRLGTLPSAVMTTCAPDRFFIASDDCCTSLAASTPLDVSELDEQPARAIAAAAVTASIAPNRILIHTLAFLSPSAPAHPWR